MTCKGICIRYKAQKPVGTGRYASGQRRCQICEIFIKWEGLWCPCCGYRLRTKPRNLKYKAKLRARVEADSKEIKTTRKKPAAKKPAAAKPAAAKPAAAKPAAAKPAAAKPAAAKPAAAKPAAQKPATAKPAAKKPEAKKPAAKKPAAKKA